MTMSNGQISRRPDSSRLHRPCLGGARASGGSTAARQRARITEMNASMATITRRVLMTAERRAGR